MAIRLSGMNSGLDTDAIVKALVSGYTTKKEKYEKAQTKLGWKQESWKSLNTKVYSMYSNISNLRFSSAYNLKKTSVSDTTKATVTASSTAPNGTQSLKIKETAKAGSLTGAQINASSSTTTLAQLGYTGGDAQINVNTGGTTKTITLSATSTMSDVEKQLKEAGLNASYDSNYKRFYISSKDTGVENDFTLTGANAAGASALYKLGIAVGASADGTRPNPYGEYAGLSGKNNGSTKTTQQNIEDARNAYVTAADNVAKYNAQSSNLLNAITYGNAYADVQDFYAAHSSADKTKLETLAKLGSGRDSAVIMKNSDDSYTTYSLTTAKDAKGNAVYKSADGKYISAEETYTADGKTYKKDSGGNYINVADETDKYSGDTAKLTKNVAYHEVTEKISYTSTTGEGDDAKEVSYTKVGDTDEKLQDADGKVYTKRADGKYYADGEPDDSKNGITITSKADYTSKEASLTNAEAANTAYTALTNGISEADLNTYTANLSTVTAFESSEDTVLKKDDDYTISKLTEAVHSAYANNGGKAGVQALISGTGAYASGSDAADNSYAGRVSALTTAAQTAQETVDKNSIVKDLAAIKDTNSEEYKAALSKLADEVDAAYDLSSSAQYNTDASKIDGKDAEIELNGVKYTGASNSFNINGLNITALSKTSGNDEISITTATDTQGIYDKIKDFLTEYNNVINEMTKLYNAASAGSYEPLTDDEKENMSDKEIEKWEQKIKDSLLKNDTTLSGVMTAMQSAMSSAVEINGKKYSFSSFGIHTLGYLNAADNEQNAYHIDGDEDDTNTSGNTDKLMAAINNDPDNVMTFMQQISNNLYKAIGDKMSSTSLSSAFTIYNDKQMSTEYSNYTKLIKEWETKISDKEDYYYKKFSAMESSLAKLNSTQSSLSSYFS